MVGETLGSYRIERRLGAGGMGEVYLAYHARLARRVAIKLLLPEYSFDANLVARFFREARAISLIDHPGIVQILDCDVHPSGRAYIVMEYLRGETLGACLRRVGHLGHDLTTALAIFSQIASALDAVHAKEIVHRDLKPENVFLTPGPSGGPPVVKILDFGIAKLAARPGDSLSKTRTGAMLGTPLYMSPEQCRATGVVDARADLYSLGCIFYETLCGHPPFTSESLADLIVAHSREAPPPLTALAPQVPESLAALIMELLAKAPEARPHPAARVVARLDAIARTVPPAASTLVLPMAPLPEMPAPDQELGDSDAAKPRPPNFARTAMLPPTPPPASTFGHSAGQVETAGSGQGRSYRWLAMLGAGAAIAAGLVTFRHFGPSASRRQSSEQTTRAIGRPTQEVPAPQASPARDDPGRRPDEISLVEVLDPPPGLELTVDGRPSPLPAALPRGAVLHALVFRAPGYQPYQVTVDASRSRSIQLNMRKDETRAERRDRKPARDERHGTRRIPPRLAEPSGSNLKPTESIGTSTPVAGSTVAPSAEGTATPSPKRKLPSAITDL